MKFLAATLSIFSMIAVSQSHANDTPSKVKGEIQDAFCGNAYDLSTVKDAVMTCILWVKTGSGQKIAAFTSNNQFLPFLDYGVEAKVLIGQKVSMESCEPLTEKYNTKRYFDAMKVLNVDKSYDYISCYPSYTKLEAPTGKNELKISKLAGLYVGKSKTTGKLVKAKVVVTKIVESEQDDLFAKPDYSIDIVYFGNEKMDEYGLAEMSLRASTLTPVFTGKTISYRDGFSDDCQDPDCYNTDGKAGFIQNKNGNYTLHLEFAHYNNAPNEYGSENDIEEKVFMKRIEE